MLDAHFLCRQLSFLYKFYVCYVHTYCARAVPRSWASALTVGYHTSLCAHGHPKGDRIVTTLHSSNPYIQETCVSECR